ncbi:hypothetical protein NPIL_654151 [Nephila pilipes]|uniref:Uncharacterized protein n=1 Tax=Nephila pilipes TaxID=299642 RepID=A0A8X6NDN3_NEPPI|nr:hypothetical protein NPIL_654151 [Nephila pilipes]
MRDAAKWNQLSRQLPPPDDLQRSAGPRSTRPLLTKDCRQGELYTNNFLTSPLGSAVHCFRDGHWLAIGQGIFTLNSALSSPEYNPGATIMILWV